MFTTEIPVLINHLNYGNHVGYDSFFSIVQEARIRWLKQYGLSEVNLGDNIGIIVSHASMDYKAEVFHGDILKVCVSIENYKKKKFDFVYTLTNSATGLLVAQGLTTQFFFDYAARRTVYAPQMFMDNFLQNSKSD